MLYSQVYRNFFIFVPYGSHCGCNNDSLSVVCSYYSMIGIQNIFVQVLDQSVVILNSIHIIVILSSKTHKEALLVVLDKLDLRNPHYEKYFLNSSGSDFSAGGV